MSPADCECHPKKGTTEIDIYYLIVDWYLKLSLAEIPCVKVLAAAGPVSQLWDSSDSGLGEQKSELGVQMMCQEGYEGDNPKGIHCPASCA